LALQAIAGLPPASTQGPLFPVVSGLPRLFGQKTIQDRCAMRWGWRADTEVRPYMFGIEAYFVSTAAPRPAARDQRPCRGHGRLLSKQSSLACPRHGRCCRCATDAASLTCFVIAVPSSPSEAKGEEGTSNVGGGVR